MRRGIAAATLLAVAGLVVAATTVPVAVEQPGTQPTEVNGFTGPQSCEHCHGGTSNPALEPIHGWRGSMMAHALRDGLFWAALAVAEQDLLPDPDPAKRGGAGDLCLRCHGPDGWIQGFSTPTDGSEFLGTEEDGVECEMCHLMVNPDLPINVAGTTEVQVSPYLAYDATTGDAYLGSAQLVFNGDGTRLGPFTNAAANHPFLQSAFFRSGELCGSCHDVSNPAIGDLAHNHGAMQPLPPGSWAGTLNAAPGDTAAFNNPPFAYGIVERTFSEWKASALDALAVNDYPTLPAELRRPGGILDIAYHRAFDARGDADYEDGTTRTFTCQTCHMSAATGVGCNKNGAPVRTDLPRHDLTGGSYWSPDLLVFQADAGTMRVGSLTDAHRAALADGKARAEAMLASAAAVSARQTSEGLEVRVTNLTGHKLITGYPEGRRLWLHVQLRDAADDLIEEWGGYGPIGRTVTDSGGIEHSIESILDPAGTVLYEVEPGMDQAWASQLLGFGLSPSLVLAFHRLTDQPVITLGQLAAAPPDTAVPTFHFVLNNVITHDTRIPPYGFSRDEALARSAVPIPTNQFGDPSPGEAYDHYHDVTFTVPGDAVRATVRLLYQQTSWEYIQHLWLANDSASPFLGTAGQDLLDAWLNTGMAAPFEMARVELPITPQGPVFTDGFEGGDTTAWSESTS